MKPSLFLCVPLAAAFCLAGCGSDEPPTPRPSAQKFPSPKRLETGSDGLSRLNGQSEPYTGAAVVADREMRLRYFAYYQQGKLHGPELRYYEDGTLRKQFDYEHGWKVRHREWFPNAQIKIDGTFVKGHAIGPHRTWFEDGRPRWSGAFGENLKWEGHIVDHATDGKVMWDALFKDGRYVSGIYPESEQEIMIKKGLVKPENALYPRQPTPSAPAPTEAAPPAQKAEPAPEAPAKAVP